MKKLRVLFFILVLFASFWINKLNADFATTREFLIKTENWLTFANKIDGMVDYMKTDYIRLRLLNIKIKSLSEKIWNLGWKKTNQLKIILKYFSEKIESELPKNDFNDDVDPNHIKTPEKVKSLYFTGYSGGNSKKIEELIYFVKNSEINSVTIDIKEVDWYTSFDMSGYEFDKIKPVTSNNIKDIKAVIKKLHENNIYVIWRMTVFKDKLLAETRSDLAIKWSNNKSAVWYDYSWNKYLDPYSKEVRDYIINISRAAYKIWFDEINYDYVRFPSDWYISRAYYPFANNIVSQNPTRWKIMVLDKFSNYVTSRLKAEFPNIVLSADVFWLVTSQDLFGIWQSLESFVLYFDYIWPMTYPSHYWVWSYWARVPDNAPYAIIKGSLNDSNNKIDVLNTEIKNAIAENRKVSIKWAFSAEKLISELKEIPKSKIRPWLQWFTCTRCSWATPYNRTKFREQIRWANGAWIDSWWVWSSSNTYYFERFNK